MLLYPNPLIRWNLFSVLLLLPGVSLELIRYSFENPEFREGWSHGALGSALRPCGDHVQAPIQHTIASHESCAGVLRLILQGRGQDQLPTLYIHTAEQASITQNIGLDAVYIGCILLNWKDSKSCYISWIRVNQVRSLTFIVPGKNSAISKLKDRNRWRNETVLVLALKYLYFIKCKFWRERVTNA